MRRTWLKGLLDVTKRYVIAAAAAHNLSRIMRMLFGTGKPRGLLGYRGRSAAEFTPSNTHPTRGSADSETGSRRPPTTL